MKEKNAYNFHIFWRKHPSSFTVSLAAANVRSKLSLFSLEIIQCCSTQHQSGETFVITLQLT